MPFYGVITWDSLKGQDHRRLWESQVFETDHEAVRATIARRDEIEARGITRLRCMVIETAREAE
jgi:hypothetical protein